MHDLRIRITESDGIRYATGINPYASTLYVGDNIKDALDAMLEEMQGFAHHNPKTMVDALHFCPEFCQLAAAVHGLHLAESDETPTTEAIGILTRLRDSRQPGAIRTRAGNLLIDIAEDDHAVCDASSVDDRPGQDAGAALETIGAIRVVWWEGGAFSQTDKRIGVLEEVETEGRICSVYTIVDAEEQRWMGNNIEFPEVTP